MYLVDTGRLHHAAIANYLTNSDRRIIAGARFVLEALDIPFPDYLERRPAGRPFGNRVMDDFRRDNPETLHQMTVRKSQEAAARIPVNAP